MKFFNTLVLASTALAFPTATKDKRQTVGITANEFKLSGCKDIIFVWARGSTELGNMVGFGLSCRGSHGTRLPDPSANMFASRELLWAPVSRTT